jgi:hypothetical protein
MRGANRLHAAIAGRRGAALVPDPYEAGDEEFGQFLDSANRPAAIQYFDPRFLRQAAAHMRSPGYRGEFDHVPRDVLERAEAVQPVKAAQIRKRVKSMLVERFAATPEKWAGETRFRCCHEGQAFTVMPDYGARTAQLRHDVAYVAGERLLDMATLNYQEVLGIRGGDWDSITEENLDDVMDLLGRLLVTIAELPERVRRLS